MKREPVNFRAATLDEEKPAMREYLLQCRRRAQELELISRESPESPQERALKAQDRTDRARETLRQTGPLFLTRLGVGIAQADLLFNGLQPLSLVEKAKQWWAKSTKPFLVLGGKSGTGKTMAALSLLPAACAYSMELQSGEEFWGWEPKALVVPAHELSQLSLYEKKDDQRRERLKRIPLLILDDLGAEAATSVSAQTLLEVLDSRMANARKTVITTNLEGEELRKRYQGRVLRRLQEQGEWLSGNVDGREPQA